jgi:uncharacterized protein
VALAGDHAGVAAPARVVRERLRPHVVLAAAIDGAPSAVPLLEGRRPVDDLAAAYVCERFACLRPITAPDELRELLDAGVLPRPGP